jgi:hypothetical protein
MILKLMFRAPDEATPGSPPIEPTTVWIDRIDVVVQHDPETWEELKYGTMRLIAEWKAPIIGSPIYYRNFSPDDPPTQLVFVAVAHQHGNPSTLIEVRDQLLFGVWLMSDEGKTVDTLYSDW